MQKPDENLIEAVLAKCDNAEEEGSRFSGMTYEEGVRDTVKWLLFDEEPPLES